MKESFRTKPISAVVGFNSKEDILSFARRDLESSIMLMEKNNCLGSLEMYMAEYERLENGEMPSVDIRDYAETGMRDFVEAHFVKSSKRKRMIRKGSILINKYFPAEERGE